MPSSPPPLWTSSTRSRSGPETGLAAAVEGRSILARKESLQPAIWRKAQGAVITAPVPNTHIAAVCPHAHVATLPRSVGNRAGYSGGCCTKYCWRAYSIIDSRRHSFPRQAAAFAVSTYTSPNSWTCEAKSRAALGTALACDPTETYQTPGSGPASGKTKLVIGDATEDGRTESRRLLLEPMSSLVDSDGAHRAHDSSALNEPADP